MDQITAPGLSTGQIIVYAILFLFGGGGVAAIIVAYINGWFSKPKVMAEAEGQALQNEIIRQKLEREGTTATEYFSNKVDALLIQCAKANEGKQIAESERDAQILVVRIREAELERCRQNTAAILKAQGRAEGDADRYKHDLESANARIAQLEGAAASEQHRQLTKTLLRTAGTETYADHDSGLGDEPAGGSGSVRDES